MSDIAKMLADALESVLSGAVHYQLHKDEQCVLDAREALAAYTAAQQAQPEPVSISRDEGRRYCDPGFQKWLDESVTENAEFTVWDMLKSVHDAYSGWCAFSLYADRPVEQSEGKDAERYRFIVWYQDQDSPPEAVRECFQSAHRSARARGALRPSAEEYEQALDAAMAISVTQKKD